MTDLNSFRERIDAIDLELLNLLNERAQIAQEIGALKAREGLPIYSPNRERHLLTSLVEQSDGPLSPESVRAIYREIMSASLAIEKDISIACLGPSGSPTHQAARDKFGSSVNYSLFHEVTGVFAEVRRDEADCGVLPIDEPGHGLVNATLDSLAQTDLMVCAQILLSGEPGDEARTAARYLIIGKNSNQPSGNDGTMLMLRIEDKPGALVSALEPFRRHDINLDYFASRRAARGSSDIYFFCQADGHSRDLQVSDVFRDLSMKCRAVKMLGSYPKPVAE